MWCVRCGGALLEAREAVPYLGPGPFVVELQDVRVRKCSACAHRNVEVPELHALDILVRALWVERPHQAPQLVFDRGHWRVARLAERKDDLPEGCIDP